MGFLVLLLLCSLILINQYRSSRKVILFEKYSRLYLGVIRTIAFLFIAWGIFFLQDIAFIFITILIAIILWVHPYTTGLSQSEIIYQQWGVGAFSPKVQKISDITDISIKESKNNNIKLILSIKNQFQIQMVFNKNDREKIEQLLQNIYI